MKGNLPKGVVSNEGKFTVGYSVVPLLRDHPKGLVKGGLSKEVVSDEGEINMGHIHICDQQNLSYKRGGLSKKVLLYTVHTNSCIYVL